MSRVQARGSFIVFAAIAAILVAAAAPAAGQSERPRIAVIEFDADADQQWYRWWQSGGAGAVQEQLVTELVKSRKFRVIEREKLDALLREKNLALSGALDPSTAVRAGKLLGVDYLMTGAITEYGTSTANVNTRSVGRVPGVRVGRKKFACAINARIIDTETGEILWADDVREETKSAKVNVGGFGGGADDNAMFDRVVKPAVQQLVESVKEFF